MARERIHLGHVSAALERAAAKSAALAQMHRDAAQRALDATKTPPPPPTSPVGGGGGE